MIYPEKGLIKFIRCMMTLLEKSKEFAYYHKRRISIVLFPFAINNKLAILPI